MVIMFLLLLLFDFVVGVLVYFVARRLLAHMAEDEQAAELISRHVIAPILRGRKIDAVEEVPDPKPEPKPTKSTLA